MKIYSIKQYCDIIITLLMMGAISSCSPSQNLFDSVKNAQEGTHKIDQIPDYMDLDLQMDRDELKNAMLPKRDKGNEKKQDSRPELPELSPILSSPTKQLIGNGKRVSLSITEDIPLKDVLIELSRLADLDMELDPGITGGIILRVKDKPIDQVMERIAYLAFLRYEVVNDVLRIKRDLPYIVNYPATFLNLERSSEGSVSISTQVLGGAGGGGEDGGGGGGSLSSGSENQITSTYDGNLWESIQSGLQSILAQNAAPTTNESSSQDSASSQQGGTLSATPSVQGSQASAPIGEGNTTPFVSLNRQAGMITVFANSRQHADVKEYLDKVKRSATSQVLIEAKILEITLDDEYRTGINWNFLDENLDLNVAGSFTDAIAGQTDIFTFTGLSKIGAIESAVILAERFGTSRTLSSPRLLATNNQQAILTFAENQVYFTLTLQEEETDDSSGDNTSQLTVESELNSVPIGVILTLQPNINLDTNEITMNIRPTLSRITDRIEDPGTTLIARREGITDITSAVPVVEVREMDSVVRIDSGEVIVIGGLMEERSINEDKGLPGLSNIPAIGNLFKSVSKVTTQVETVIFIKATIVPAHGSDKHDRHLYRTFSNDPRPLAF